jgi:hypothetical protein
LKISLRYTEINFLPSPLLIRQKGQPSNGLSGILSSINLFTRVSTVKKQELRGSFHAPETKDSTPSWTMFLYITGLFFSISISNDIIIALDHH